MLRSRRQHCQRCHKTRSVYPAEVVPYFRYARSVITTALERRAGGWSWERCAWACTADGLVAASVVRRWDKSFENGGGHDQRGTPFSTGSGAAKLGEPAGIRSFEPQQQEQWARSVKGQEASPPLAEPSLNVMKRDLPGLGDRHMIGQVARKLKVRRTA